MTTAVQELQGIITDKELTAVDLPTVSIDASLEEALAGMKRAGRSGVVARDGDSYWLYKAGWVVVGIGEGKRTLADIGHCFRVFKTTATDLASKSGLISIHNIQGTIALTYPFTDRRLFTLAHPFSPADQIIGIVTRDTLLAAELSSGPTGYYCTNPNRPDDPHPYLPPPLPSDRKCTRDGSPIVATG